MEKRPVDYTPVLGLVPIRNFGEVIPNIFRSAQPHYDYEYEWMRDKLGVRHIISLREERDVDSKHADATGLHHTQIHVKDHHSPDDESIRQFATIITAPDNIGALWFHCEHGHGRTSIFSVIAKVLNGWSVDRAVADEHDRFHYNFKYLDQIEFLRTLESRLERLSLLPNKPINNF